MHNSRRRSIIGAVLVCVLMDGATADETRGCDKPQGIESGAILRFKGAVGSHSTRTFARYALQNQTRHPLTLWLSGREGERFLTGGAGGYEYPDINGSWVRHIHAVGSEFDVEPYVIEPASTLTFRFVLPSDTALRASGGRARLVVEFGNSDLCVYSTTLKAKMSKPRIHGFEKA